MKCVTEKVLLRRLAGQLPPGLAAAAERHLAGCARCAKLQEDISAMTRRLAPDPGELEDPDLAGDVMTLIRLGRAGRPEPEARPRMQPAWLLIPLATVAAAFLFFLAWFQLGPVSEQAPEFQTRGGPETRPDRWASLKIFRASPGGYLAVDDSLRADDALAFTYDNRSEDAFEYLMVFAADASGRVFWYYPTHQTAGANPTGVSIERTSRPRALPDEVRHELEPGYLLLIALFSRSPLDVQTVEAALRRDLARAGSIERLQRLAIEDTGQQLFGLTVQPAALHADEP